MGPATDYCDRLTEALSRPGALPGAERVTSVVRSPGAVAFVTARRRLKLMTEGLEEGLEPSARRAVCERAYRRNRQLSSHAYLGLVPIVQLSGEPPRLVEADRADPGDQLDWLIECRAPLPEHSLTRRVEAGRAPRGFAEALAGELARFHGRARTGPGINRRALFEPLREEVAGRLERLGGRLDAQAEARCAPLLAFLGRATARFLEQHRGLFELRVADWCIREGHGGLACAAIEVDESGGVDIWDCGDAGAEAACGDVLRDLARLTVDLDDRGAAAWSAAIARLYALRSGDGAQPQLTAFYRTLAAVELAGACAADEPIRAERLVQLAVGYQLERCRVSFHLAGTARAQREACVERALKLASRLLVTPRPQVEVRRRGLPELEVLASGSGRQVRVELPLDRATLGGSQAGGDRPAPDDQAAWCSQALGLVVDRLVEAS